MRDAARTSALATVATVELMRNAATDHATAPPMAAPRPARRSSHQAAAAAAAKMIGAVSMAPPDAHLKAAAATIAAATAVARPIPCVGGRPGGWTAGIAGKSSGDGAR